MHGARGTALQTDDSWIDCRLREDDGRTGILRRTDSLTALQKASLPLPHKRELIWPFCLACADSTKVLLDALASYPPPGLLDDEVVYPMSDHEAR